MLSTIYNLLVLCLLASTSTVFAAPGTPTVGGLAGHGHTPTRIQARHGGGGHNGPAPSQGGSPSGKKCIKVTKNIGGATLTLGYVGNSFEHGKGTYKITPWRWECLAVLVPSTSGPFDLPIKGANGSKRFLGLAGDDSKSAMRLVRTAQTSPGSTPQGVGNSGVHLPLSESAVWSTDGRKLTATWWTQSGTAISAKAYHWLANPDALYFVTKPADFAREKFGSYQVTLELVTP